MINSFSDELVVAERWWRPVLILSSASYVFGIFISILISFVADVPGKSNYTLGVVDFVGIVVVAPLVETALLFLFVRLLLPAAGIRIAVLISVFSIAVFHSMFWVYWGVIVVVPLFLMSIPFFNYNKSWWWRCSQCASIHAIHNVIVFVTAAILE